MLMMISLDLDLYILNLTLDQFNFRLKTEFKAHSAIHIKYHCTKNERISPVNVTKFAVYFGWGHIYWRNP